MRNELIKPDASNPKNNGKEVEKWLIVVNLYYGDLVEGNLHLTSINRTDHPKKMFIFKL